MHADPEYLRQHYATLSDEGLLAIHRDDLVEVAQTCYDAELRERKLHPRQGVRRSGDSPAPSRLENSFAEEFEQEDEPDWLEHGTEVVSWAVIPGKPQHPDVENTRVVLGAAGIPFYLELSEIMPEEPSPAPTQQWRLLVPSHLNLQANGILQRDLYNQDFEADWKAHLALASDEELRGMHPEVAFCGLYDRIERVTRAYEEELAHRKL